MKSFKKVLFVPIILFALVLGINISTSRAQVTHKKMTTSDSTYTLKGKVVSARSSQALPDAQVVVVGTKLKTKTNSDGSFSLNNVPKGSQKIKVTLTGYKTWKKTINISKSTTLTIKLQHSKQ